MKALISAVERNRGTERGATAEAVLRRVAAGDVNADQALTAIVASNSLEARRYWSRLLAEAATDLEDRNMLVEILRHANLAPARTAARKALKLVDAIAYGPKIELE